MSRTLIAVVGCHRSGTSATAGVLHHLGVDFGGGLMPPSPANPKGYFESMAVVRTHQRLLRMQGRTWDTVAPMPEGWTHNLSYRVAWGSLVSWLNSLPVNGLSDTVLGVKDPRMCQLYPLWQEVCALAEVDLVPLIVIREPGSVVDSLMEREGWSAQRAAELVINCDEGVCEWMEHPSMQVVKFADLLDDWRAALRELDSLLWPRVDRMDSGYVNTQVGRATSVENFLDRSLVHHGA